jgi:hypothetical protein
MAYGSAAADPTDRRLPIGVRLDRVGQLVILPGHVLERPDRGLIRLVPGQAPALFGLIAKIRDVAHHTS